MVVDRIPLLCNFSGVMQFPRRFLTFGVHHGQDLACPSRRLPAQRRQARQPARTALMGREHRQQRPRSAQSHLQPSRHRRRNPETRPRTGARNRTRSQRRRSMERTLQLPVSAHRPLTQRGGRERYGDAHLPKHRLADQQDPEQRHRASHPGWGQQGQARVFVEESGHDPAHHPR